MATVKLGVMISEIAGSLGAVTFRRFRGTTIVSQKQRGASRNALLQNSAINVLSPIFQEWKGLSDAVRDKWISEALLFTFPDKFGTMRNITGRELFIKLTVNCKYAGFPPPDVYALTDHVPYTPIPISTIISLSGSVTLGSSIIFSENRYTLQAEILKNNSISESYTRRKILNHQIAPESFSLVWVSFFAKNFPNAEVGDVMRFYIKRVNSSGFKSDATVWKGTIIA